MILYCIRHGESVYNAQGRIQGQTDIELSALGRLQSLAVADLLAGLPIEAIYSSPLRRALDTARPLADRFGLRIRTDDRLREIHAGIFQGLRWAEIEESHPEEARQWIDQVPDFVIPGGESRRALMARGLAVFQGIREQPYEHVAIVAHGGILSAAFKALLQIPAELNPFSLANGSVSTIRWEKRIKLMTLNETCHLRDENNGSAAATDDL
jgi:broad specificity phosphatase PhoE